ncbi:MAG: hypothetical protein WA767_14410, partial [Pseudolabrys sp.]
MQAVRLQTMHNNAATNPDPGGRADGAEKYQEAGHTENKSPPECAAYVPHSRPTVVLRESHT